MSDIRRFGATEGQRPYWIKYPSGSFGGIGYLRLVLIDDAGEVTITPMGAPWDDSAPTRDEAVQAHLAGAVAEADRELERRRREAPKPEPKPPPPDAATRRFLDDENAVDLTDWKP